jgi:glutamine synthetase
MTAIGEAARTQGLPALTVTPKNTSGQFAVRLTHVDDPVRAGDAVVFLRQIVRALARQHDLDATFMAKPFLELPGNGLHAQVALEHGSAKNAFDDGTKAGSELMLFALGGLQDVMAESMALFAPSVNAYRRIIAARAPVLRNKRWSYHGGATSLRVLGDAGMGRHIEHRMAGADANPYLALAAILAGIHHGVGRRIDPGQPTGADSPAFVDETIPVAIDGALVALENGSIIREYLGGSYVDLYCATKRTELDRFRNHIPAHEYDWYF